MNPSSVIGTLLVSTGVLMIVRQYLERGIELTPEIGLGILILVAGIALFVQSIKEPPLDEFTTSVSLIIGALSAGIILLLIRIFLLIR